MTRSAFVLALVAAPAPAQYFLPYDLAISSDASQIYFISSLPPAAGSASYNPYYIYKFSGGNVGVFHAISLAEFPTGPAGEAQFNAGGLTLSADGSTVTLGLTYAVQNLPSPWQYFTSGELFTPSGTFKYSQAPILSRNGRYLYTCELSCLLYDTVQGTSQSVPLVAKSIANNGTVAGIAGASATSAIWSQQSGLQFVAQLSPSLQTAPIVEATVDPTGSHLLVTAFDSASETFYSYVVEIASGNAIQVGMPPIQFSDSGLIVALFGEDNASMQQVFLANADGSNPRQVTFEPSGILSAAISGDGSVVIALDGYGEVLHFNVAPGTREVLFETGPQQLSEPSGGLSPGSMAVLSGFALAKESDIAPEEAPLPMMLAGVQVLVDGAPAPLIKVDPGAIRLQLPWELSIGAHQIQPSRPSNSPFAPVSPISFNVFQQNMHFLSNDLFDDSPPYPPLALHQDWTPVTSYNPAHEGEILHFFATGLGPVTGAITTGEPTPLTPLFPVVNAINFGPSNAQDVTVNCSGNGSNTFSPVFVGLAPETVGIYQLDIQLTHVDPINPTAELSCQTPSNKSTATSVTFDAEPPTQ